MRAVGYLVFLVLSACHSAPAPQASTSPEPTSVVRDTAAAYGTALADFIAAMDTTATPLPDTVYIGRHPDLPHIALPTVLAGRTVSVIEPAAAEEVKHRSHFAYLNVFATYTPGRVEFFVVRFGQGLGHRRDGAEDRHLDYRVGENGELVLERVI